MFQLPLSITKFYIKIPRIYPGQPLTPWDLISDIDGALDQGAGHPERQVNFLGCHGLTGKPEFGILGGISDLNGPHHSSGIFWRDFFLASEKNQSR